MGFWRDMWHTLNYDPRREPNARDMVKAVEDSMKGCTDEECTLDPAVLLIQSKPRQHQHLLNQIREKLKQPGYHSGGLIKPPSPPSIQAQVHGGSQISIMAPETADAFEIEMQIDGEVVKFIRADKVIPLHVHETVCAAYYTAAEENEMLKEQLKEFRTFKDEDTDGVELT